MSTLTLRLDSEEEQMIERLKDYTGQSAASKALLCAGAQVITRLIPLERKCENLDRQLKANEQRIRKIREYQLTISESEHAIKRLLQNDSSVRPISSTGDRDPDGD